MWRRAYLLLLLVRLHFALSPSYLHPDENFQGPEVVAGQIFSYPVKYTWEFTSASPIRSVFPLWPVYGLPMLLLQWLWLGNTDEVPPIIVFWTLRVLMFVLSFVLEDWALHELIHSPRHRLLAVSLVASSYVTWTYQTHTFSNSIETLLVAWSLVLIQRITKANPRPSLFAPGILGIFVVTGIFNRITFPAFLLIPGLPLIPYFLERPLSFVSMVFCGLFTALIAVYVDTDFYSKEPLTWAHLLMRPTITPLNNFLYNLSPKNLATHGLHPWYQHLLINLPQLIGPAFILFVMRPHLSLRLYSALSGIFVLSIFQHQEARFLLPTVPLILSSIKFPKRNIKIWAAAWISFNVVMGLLMGTYHQGGIVPTQAFMSTHPDATQVFWWKTYSPPIWLLNGKNEVLTTHDLMGMKGDLMIAELDRHLLCDSCTETVGSGFNSTYLVAPYSAMYLDKYIGNGSQEHLWLEEVWRYRSHLNLDDLDFGDDGVWDTLSRVIGRRGLITWRVRKNCEKIPGGDS